MGRIKNLIGRKFEKLTVISLYEERDHRGGARWICDCSCGLKDIIVDATNLIEHAVKNCGCLKPERYAERQRVISEKIEHAIKNSTEKICEVCGDPFIAGSKNAKRCPKCFFKKKLGTKPSKDDW